MQQFQFHRRLACALAACLACLCAGAGPAAFAKDKDKDKSSAPPTKFSGMCDASAAFALDPLHFAVANDEDNRIRVYRHDRPGAPLQTTDLSRFLRVDPKFPETDLEGAVQIGDLVFWIGSHGANKEGKPRASRHRLFALKFNGFDAVPVGTPYLGLLRDLGQDARYEFLRSALQMSAAPKSYGAINIEGLAPGPAGGLYIGFRNPVPRRHALIVPLTNPAAVVQGSPARFQAPILLNLDGRGIRDMTRQGEVYWIIAGSYREGGHSELYRWGGGTNVPEKVESQFKGYNPEALIIYPGHPGRLQFFSDDGGRDIRGTACKDLKDPTRKLFRTFWFDLPAI